MGVEVAQATLIGGRPVNQDRAAHVAGEGALLLVLADGMGGTPRGEVAAQLAVDRFVAAFRAAAMSLEADPAEFFRQAMTAAHEDIHAYAREHFLWSPPGTTCVACLIQDGRACWAHAGDSRCYLLREGEVVARTRDHSLYQALLDRDGQSAREGAFFAERGVLTNCLGGLEAPFVEVAAPAVLQTGDVVLLCSDGLWGQLPERDIAAVLWRYPLEEAVAAVARAAEAEGGAASDNVTLIAARWRG
ncbi:PP2C family protein-serine/threonine phosphatase [Pelomicrobium methylotrophicum]|uniref:Serine/threonine-protein phosphatase n=1 Tax=Pelomicrobium methylotrophicum TaxID=2602750 RepID=A0A5C7ETD1_9PROT|nr:protein phosphatase 2C domain-containing protein [Pelomicrobium methylotrophicum]TXF10598.1 serine/threonine-protein phosphatase [Pelomicrobium methylotrophicum]